jgi:hypothetical protein
MLFGDSVDYGSPDSFNGHGPHGELVVKVPLDALSLRP